MSKRDDIVLLEDAIESIGKIESYTEKLTLQMFLDDQKTKDAVARNFEIIGEAVSRMSIEFKKKHAHINWTNLKDFRNVLIHSYEIIDYSIVWSIIKGKLASISEEIKGLFNTLNK
ncbi:MAG: DUF86 domain-containing protein [Sediminibacterium sp.]